jgi:hypothetical protein
LKVLESYEAGSVKVYFDDGITYLVKVLDRRNAGEPAPFEFEQEEIRGILVARQKREFIESTFNKVYEEGKNKKLYTIYK